MRNRLSPGLAYCGAWALAGAYNFCRGMFDEPLFPLAVFNASHFVVWAVLGLLAIPLIRRHPVGRRWRPWVFHLVVGAVFTQADITLGHLLTHRVLGTGRDMTLAQVAVQAFEGCFHIAYMTYWALLAIVQGLDAHQRAHRQALELAEHRAAATRAQLQALRSQLQPHFLFNTLHTVGALMHYDVPAAEHTLHRLGELLRMSLREGGSDAVSLRCELDFLQAYLDVEQVRFEQRLQVQWAVPAELQQRTIPPFILQPLVENAVKHGVAPRAEGGCIVVRAYEEQEELVLEVEDDAPEALPRREGLGIGLANTRARLETLYGNARRFELLRGGRGTIARLRLPACAMPGAPA